PGTSPNPLPPGLPSAAQHAPAPAARSLSTSTARPRSPRRVAAHAPPASANWGPQDSRDAPPLLPTPRARLSSPTSVYLVQTASRIPAAITAPRQPWTRTPRPAPPFLNAPWPPPAPYLSTQP